KEASPSERARQARLAREDRERASIESGDGHEPDKSTPGLGCRPVFATRAMEEVREADAGFSPPIRTVWPRRVAWSVLRAELGLPTRVRGPVDLAALRRMASICFSVAID